MMKRMHGLRFEIERGVLALDLLAVLCQDSIHIRIPELHIEVAYATKLFQFVPWRSEQVSCEGER